MALVLASASPQRKGLLARIGAAPSRVLAPEADETPRPGETAQALVLRLAGAKLQAAVRLLEAEGAGAGKSWVLAADTVAACGRRLLAKPEDEAGAERMLRLLSGRRHRVWTGVAVCRLPDGAEARRVVCSCLRFRRFSEEDLAELLASGEWRGRAGGYAIQGRAEAQLAWLSGSYSNVAGLPLAETRALLRGLGWREGAEGGRGAGPREGGPLRAMAGGEGACAGLRGGGESGSGGAPGLC